MPSRYTSGVERQPGQDRGFGCGVVAVDVGGGVGFGITQRGGLGQSLVEAGATGVHARQDEVGGAVDDAHHARDPVARQRLAQRAQQRDRAGDGRFVVQVDPRAAGGLVQRRTVLGQQGLVGTDHALAAGQRREQQRPDRFDPADHLDHQVDVVAGDECCGVGGEQVGIDVGVLARAPHSDADQFERHTHTSGQVVGLLVQQPYDLRADDAAAQQRNAQSVAHADPSQPVSSRSMSSSVSRRTMTLETPSRTATTGGRGTWL
jgi:hypothetical protein